MKTTAMAIVIVLGSAAVAPAGWYSVDGIDTADFINSSSMLSEGVEAFIGTDKAIYRRGENVRMFFKLTNLRDDHVTSMSPHIPAFHFIVQKDGQTIWRQAHVFSHMVVVLDLPPGASKGRVGKWDMRDDNGNVVGTGTFEVVEAMDWLVLRETWDGGDPFADPGDLIPFADNPRVPITVIPYVPLTGNRGPLDSALQQIAVDGGNSITTALTTLQTSAQACSAYDQLSGQSRPPLAPVTTAGTTRSMAVVSDRMRHSQNGMDYGFGGPLLAMAEPGDTGDTESTWDTQPSGHAFAVGSGTRHFGDRRWGLWARGYGVFGDRQTETEVPGYQYKVYGTGFGFDYRFTSRLLFGVTGGCSSGDVAYSVSRDGSDIASTHVGFYGSFNTDSWYLDSVLTYTPLQYDTERYVDLTGERLTGNFDGRAIGGYFEAGVNWYRNNYCLLQPLAAFQYSHLAVDGYAESGGASALTYGPQSYDSYKGSLGLKVTRALGKQTDGCSALIQLRGRWTHEFGDAGSNVLAHFAGSPDATFIVSDGHLSRDSAVLGAGLSAQLNNNTWLSVDYDASLNADGTAHIISGGLVYRH
ncbi:MAG: autotransporter domain-containing protein [Phycisphaerales bacterium]|nr:MAG: autotransporter domain-containing protein [Phycisphaerales bacterium]